MGMSHVPSEAILNKLPGAFIWKDINLLYQAANINITKNFGFKSIEHMMGLTSYDIACPAVEYADQFLKNDREVIQSQKNLQTLDIHQFADGKIKIFLGERAPLFNDDNEVCGVLYQAIEVYQSTLLQIGMILGKRNQEFYEKKDHKKGYRFLIKKELPLLSEREFEILFYFLRGKTAKQTAKLTNISHRTVEFHINSIKCKMLCHTKNQIIERSVEMGLMNVIPISIFHNNSLSNAIII